MSPPVGAADPDPGPRAGLHVDGVTVRFGPTTAVEDVVLSVAPGEVVALLGPSGCGKSTLLRSVAGLQRVDEGRILWDGRDLAGVPVHRRGFGLLFQDGQLFAHRDVAGNVAFGLQMAGVGREHRRARTAELLELVGLEGYGRRSVATLSGGEQQRVALARALAPRPRLLLLDEPLTGLDRALRERLAGELAAILRHEGTSALHVTHDHDEAFAVADRIAVMSSGRLLQVDTPARLWSTPASRSVAEFLGYSILLHPPGSGSPPGLFAVAPGALRIVGPAGEEGGVPGWPTPTDPPLVGVVVSRRGRRGGGCDVDLRIGRAGQGPGPTVTAGDDSGRPWAPGQLVELAVDPAGAITVPRG